jgi:hypothetical protein
MKVRQIRGGVALLSTVVRPGSRGPLLVLAIALASLELSGCHAGGDGITTLDNGAVASSLELEPQAERAQRYYDCLTESRVPAELNDFAGRQKSVELKGEWWVSWRDGIGLEVMGDPVGVMLPEWTVRAMDGVDPTDGAARLVIDGLDYSAAYAECLEMSQYDPPGYWADPGQELIEKQAVAVASNAWAACARDHGYPDIADAGPVVADGSLTFPEVVIPVRMSVDELRLLLKSCPFFDEARAIMERDAEARGEEVDYGVVPRLEIEGLARGRGDSLRDVRLEPWEVDHAVELHNVLYEDLNAFWGGDGG